MWGGNGYWRACIAAVLGERERAVTFLRGAFAEGLAHSGDMDQFPKWIDLHVDIDLESLRDYPPYQELVKPKG